jgi:hypothetical protein
VDPATGSGNHNIEQDVGIDQNVWLSIADDTMLHARHAFKEQHPTVISSAIIVQHTLVLVVERDGEQESNRPITTNR